MDFKSRYIGKIAILKNGENAIFTQMEDGSFLTQNIKSKFFKIKIIDVERYGSFILLKGRFGDMKNKRPDIWLISDNFHIVKSKDSSKFVEKMKQRHKETFLKYKDIDPYGEEDWDEYEDYENIF